MMATKAWGIPEFDHVSSKPGRDLSWATTTNRCVCYNTLFLARMEHVYLTHYFVHSPSSIVRSDIRTRVLDDVEF